MAHRIFLLSPASCAGERARLLLREEADFPLARRLREDGAPIGEVFSFLSGLYFRGKISYARAFASAPPRAVGTLVITPTHGLIAPDERVTRRDILRFSAVPIDPRERRYRKPLERDARRLAGTLEAEDEVVLLGSIATAKYVDVLGAALGERLRFPAEFAGRGDMSRGGLLLRRAREGRELTYVGIASGVRHGPRPPRLAPAPRAGRENRP
jgi:hypothetical protein